MGLSPHTSDLLLLLIMPLSVHVEVINRFLNLTLLIVLLTTIAGLSCLRSWSWSHISWPSTFLFIGVLGHSYLPCSSWLRHYLLLLLLLLNQQILLEVDLLLFSQWINSFSKCSLSQSILIHIFRIVLFDFFFNRLESLYASNVA